MDAIDNPTESDCLLTSGNPSRGARNLGNRRFHEIVVNVLQEEYNASAQSRGGDKLRLVAQIIAEWKSQFPQGRFLTKFGGCHENLWREVGDEEVKMKVARAMKDNMRAKGTDKIRVSSASRPPPPSGTKTRPGDNDFLVQHGAFSHPGNRNCRKMVDSVRENFLTAETAYGRNRLVSLLVLRWRSQSPPGGFLKQDDVSKCWYDVGDEFASKQIHRALMVMDIDSRRRGGKSPEDEVCGSVGDGHRSSSRPSLSKAEAPLNSSGSNRPTVSNREQDVFWPLLGIQTPGDHDCTHQKNDLSQPGNRRCRALLEANREKFRLAKTLDKRLLIASQVVNSWRSQNPPGRFLKLNTNTNLWYDVGDKCACQGMIGMLAQLLSMKDDTSKDDNSSGEGEPALLPRGYSSPSEGGHSQNDSPSGIGSTDSPANLQNESRFVPSLIDTGEYSQSAPSASFVGLQNEPRDAPRDTTSPANSKNSSGLSEPPLLPRVSSRLLKDDQNENEDSVRKPQSLQNNSINVASATDSSMLMCGISDHAAAATHLAHAVSHPETPLPSPLFDRSDVSTQVLINTGAVLHGAVGELTSNLQILLLKCPQLQQEDAVREIQGMILPGLSFLSESMMSIGWEQKQQLDPDQQQQGEQQLEYADSHSSIDDALADHLGNPINQKLSEG